MRVSLETRYGGAQFDYAAPVVGRVVISDVCGRPCGLTPAGLIDTGASRTAIPLQVATALGIVPVGFRKPVVATGATGEAYPLVVVRLEIEEVGAKTLEVYAMPRATVLIGRDLLAEMQQVLAVDWRRGTFSLTRATQLRGVLLRIAGM